MKGILNPSRFTKPNSIIKSGFYVSKIVRMGSSLPYQRGLYFHFEIFSKITWIIDLSNFNISTQIYIPFFTQYSGKNIKPC